MLNSVYFCTVRLVVHVKVLIKKLEAGHACRHKGLNPVGFVKK